MHKTLIYYTQEFKPTNPFTPVAGIKTKKHRKKETYMLKTREKVQGGHQKILLEAMGEYFRESKLV